jgi:hypothetical protein
MRSAAAILLALPLAACGGGTPAPAPEPPAPDAPAFAYRMPATDPLVYQQVDSGGFTMQMQGVGNIDVSIAANVTAELDFAPQGEALQVTVSVTDLSGSFINSMAPAIGVDNQHRPAPATLRIEPTGDVTIVERPVFSEQLAQVITPDGLYRSFFIRLPGGEARRGDAWTDTIRISEAEGGMQVNTTSIVRSVWARDTTVGGRTLAVITASLENVLSVSGNSQGVEVVQNLRGTSSAVSLWDPQAAVLVERRETGQATGTTDLPGMGLNGIPVTARNVQLIRLVR